MKNASKQAIFAAVIVAFVVGAPVSVVAIQKSAAERAEEAAAHARRVATHAAVSQLDRVLEDATVGARASAAVFAEALADGEQRATVLASEIAQRAEQIVEVSPVVREYSVVMSPRDTWQGIADEWGLSGTELAQLNPDVDLNNLAAGDELRVYRYRAALQSRSVGAPNRGRVVNAMPMPRGEHWVVRNERHSWGTAETVSHLVRGFTHVGTTIPNAGTPLVADLSRKRGGRLRPHRSHTSGRDVDVTYYRNDGQSALWRHTSRNTLDKAAQWALFRYWIERDLVTYIFIGHRLSRALHDHAVSIGEDPAFIETAFGEQRGRGILRYSPGHDDHLHVRFRCAPDDGSCREH